MLKRRCSLDCFNCEFEDCFSGVDLLPQEIETAEKLDNEILQERQAVEKSQEWYKQGSVVDPKLKLQINTTDY